jgi:hypothetical protein
MRRFWLVVLATFAGYALGGLAGWGLILALSPNTHDRSVEAAMSAAFVFGPIAAVVAAVLTLWATKRMRGPV